MVEVEVSDGKEFDFKESVLCSTFLLVFSCASFEIASSTKSRLNGSRLTEGESGENGEGGGDPEWPSGPNR